MIHDFFYRFTKQKSTNAEMFDLQIQISEGMTNATAKGSKYLTGLTFAGLFTYCLKGRSIMLRVVYGTLFMYWMNHIYTLGSYAGVIIKMPCT